MSVHNANDHIPGKRPPNELCSEQFLSPTFEGPRRIYLNMFVGGCMLIMLTILSVLPIYWGSLWRTPVGTLQGWIVDFDGGIIGQTVVQHLTSDSIRSQSSSRILWEAMPASSFPAGSAQLEDAVVEQHVWVAIAILENSSRTLQNSYASPDTSYNGTIIHVYVSEARNENAYRLLTRPSVEAQLDNFSSQFAIDAIPELLQNSSVNLSALLTSSPQTVLAPIGYRIENLRPFDSPVASAVTFIGLIFQLILISFVVVTSYGAREASGINKRLTLRSLLQLRFGSSFLAYLFVSLFYTLVSLMFQLSLSRKFGNGGFFVFWMLNYVGMLSVGLALESLITLVTARFIPFFLIMWIIVNLAVSLFPIEILPAIYRYGYAMPFYNISHGIRCVLFGTKNTIAKNFVILIAWTAISCITLPLYQWFVCRKDARQTEKGKSSSAAEKIPQPHSNGVHTG